jgi:hypothetical protein
MTTERNPEMSRNRSFERRAREEVERIKAQEAAEEERKQARMKELAEQARERREVEAAEQRRRKEERDASSGATRMRRLKVRSGWPGTVLGDRGQPVAGPMSRSIRRGQKCGRRCCGGAPWTPIGGRVKRCTKVASAAFSVRS